MSSKILGFAITGLSRYVSSPEFRDLPVVHAAASVATGVVQYL